MRSLISLVLLGAFCINVQAQSFSFSPDTLLEVTAELNQYNIFQIDINNETSDSLTLSWRRLQHDYPENWEVSFCDNNVCYGLIPINGNMIPFAPEEYAFLKLDVNPHDVAGTGIFRFMVFPTDDSDAVQLASFIIHAGMTNSLSSPTGVPHLQQLIIKGNPVVNQLGIDNPNDSNIALKVYDSAGRQLSTSHLMAHSSTNIDFTPQASGSYTILGFINEHPLFNYQIIKL